MRKAATLAVLGAAFLVATAIAFLAGLAVGRAGHPRAPEPPKVAKHDQPPEPPKVPPRAEPRPPEDPRPDAIDVMFGAAGLLTGRNLPKLPPEEEKPWPRPGDKVRIVDDELGSVWVAVDEAAFGTMVSLREANDPKSAVRELERRGQVFVCRQEVLAVVVKVTPIALQVRIAEGFNRDKTGWVQREFVKRTGPHNDQPRN
jgi:hypothetical protein